MAGINVSGYSPTPMSGLLASGKPPTSVSWASRGGSNNASWTMPSQMPPELAGIYAQGDINRGMQQGQQSYQTALMQAQRGWQLEDQKTALDLYGSATGGGAGSTPARETGDDSAWGAMLAGQMGAAKDNAAAAVGAARRSMVGNMTARGIGGSGIEAKNERAIQLAGAGQIGAAGRDAATLTANRQAAINDRNYAGNITQRGQDITAQGQKLSLMPSILSLLRAGVSY
jgi:hypothetical protein